MRLVLLVLGLLLLAQSVFHIIQALMHGPVSFTTIGQTMDKDLVRLTAGLCAVYLSRLPKSKL